MVKFMNDFTTEYILLNVKRPVRLNNLFESTRWLLYNCNISVMPVVCIDDIAVDFPFQPYNVQLEYMKKVIEALNTNQNAVLESPTGTGKTLCLLCSTLAWRKAQIANASSEPVQLKLPEGLSAWADDSGKKNDAHIPKIVYSSRTHSQLKQVVNELKRTSYGKSAVISILGSREQMCVHPEVSQQSNNMTMVHMCRNKVNKRTCHYYNNVESAVKSGVFTNKVLDIEDMVTVGKQCNACPYYAAREVSKQASCAIVFTPYNYLLDRRTRSSQNLEIGGNILIVDEAHNLEKVCEESASFDLTSLDFAHCIDEVGDLLTAVTKMVDTGVVSDGHEAGETSALSEFSKEDLALLKQLFLTLEKELDAIELSCSKDKVEKGIYIFEYFSKVNLTFETFHILLQLIEKVSSYLSTLSTSYRTRGINLQKFAEIIKIVFNASRSSGDSSLNGLFSGLHKKIASTYRVYISEDNKSKNVTKKKSAVSTKPNRTLSYWCFSPGYAMNDLMACGVRNLVLTSGTLSPIQTFIDELQVDFPITLQNNHVIDKHQIFVASLLTGASGKILEATYKSRSEESKVIELGYTMVEILKLSPGGALIFFPSYSSMTHYINFWRERCDIMKVCELYKSCIIESRDIEEMKVGMEKYYNDVKSNTGAALFAVCKGKVSEGLDFSNDNGRTVIVIGIPYPPIQDPKVKLKKSFLDDQRKSRADAVGGNDWYRQQACRSVNQAIGRVIRHRHDYGAIILCDHRYSKKEIVGELPQWLQNHVNEFDRCPKFLRRLKSFFCSAQEKDKLCKGEIRKQLPNQAVKTPLSSAGQISFGIAQDSIHKLPKGNQVDLHMLSKGCMWRNPKRNTSLLDALDEAENEDECSENPQTCRSCVETLMSSNQQLEKYRPSKKKKIILKPITCAGIAHGEGPAVENVKSSTTVPAELLASGSPQFYLTTIRKTLSSQNYSKFKEIIKIYKTNKDLSKLVTALSTFLLVDEQSRELMKGFIRFLSPDCHDVFNSMLQSLV